MKKEYVDTDEVPQMAEDTGGKGGNSTASETKDNSLWWLGGFLVALVILAIVLAFI